MFDMGMEKYILCTDWRALLPVSTNATFILAHLLTALMRNGDCKRCGKTK